MSFEIKELYCQYPNSETPVLHCEELSISSGKIYFVLGKSGIGKSTLLEALGLMSNTITETSITCQFVDPSGNQVDLKELWKSEKISAFRQEKYSFIFQSNNLMENFTAGENMAFGMLMSGKAMGDIEKELRPIMEDIDLPEDCFKKDIQYLSGGQRQRVAFVRAFTAPFQVLFGDEPTGNLDEVVANKLMAVLKRKISRDNKTAIIVSHNIDLALQFADEILILSESEEKQGYLGPNNRMTKAKNGRWLIEGNDIEDPRNYLNRRIS